MLSRARHASQKTHQGLASDRQASVLLARDAHTLEAAYDAWAEHYDEDLIQLSSGGGGGGCGGGCGGGGENCPGIAATKVLVKMFDKLVGHVGDKKKNGKDDDDNNNNDDDDNDDHENDNDDHETSKGDDCIRILDFGCGTGRAALYLQEHGLLDEYNIALYGCDLSRGMLDVAAQRNLYHGLIKADFTESHAPGEGTWDIVHASGVFAPGQAPPSAFDEFWRLLRPAGVGYAVFTIRVGYYDSDEGSAHRHHLEQLIKEKKWELVAKPEVDYLPNDDVKAYVFVMRKL